jgi:hypothetical protein
MAWSTLNADAVLSEFTETERAALTAAQDSVDNLNGIITRVIGMARGMIAAGGNTLGAAGTVPDQVALDVIAIARHRWIAAVPKLRALATAERKAAHDDGMKRLESIAAGSVRVEPPAHPISTESAVPGPSFGTRGGSRATDPNERRFNSATQDGL